MAENLIWEIVYLSEAFHWGFNDIWGLPTQMRKKFISTYEELLRRRRESENKPSLNS